MQGASGSHMAGGQRPGGGGGESVMYRSISTGLVARGPPGMTAPGMVPIEADLEAATVAANGASAEPANGEAAQVARPLLGEIKYKYSRLNLAINQHGEQDSSIVKAHRPISMFWQEKLGLLLFYLQCHALIWLQCYNFYPAYWRAYWRWTLITILDVANFVKDEGGPNTGGDTAFHTIIILLLPILSLIGYELLCRLVYSDRIAGSIKEDKHWVSYLTFQKCALLYAEQLYVPIVLVFFRVWTCDSKDSVTYIYRNVQCWTADHWIMIIVIGIISIFFQFAMPIVIYRRMKRIVVFHEAGMHERYLQSRELEYIMGCNNLYEYTFFFYIGSFKRFWAWTRLSQLLQKYLLCLFLIALNGYNAGDSGLMPQSILFLAIISGPVVLNVFYRAYRCPSSNYLKAIFDSIMFFTCVMNVIEANPTGFSSSFIDQYTFSYMMLLVNCVGLFFAGLLCGYHFFQQRRKIHGGRDIYWPVRETDLLALSAARPEMISSLNIGKRLLEEALHTAEEFYPRANLLDAVNNMRTLLAEAKARREGKSRRSQNEEARRPIYRQMTREEELELIATLALGEEKSRALEWTLQDMVEDLSLLYNTITARVKSAAGDTANANAGGGGLDTEMARFDRMQGAFQGFSEDLQEKSRERALMHPLKRDFLAKMLVIKGLAAAGNVDFVYGERPPWTAPTFLPAIATADEEELARPQLVKEVRLNMPPMLQQGPRSDDPQPESDNSDA